MLRSVFPGVHDRLVNGRICIAIAGMVCKDWSIRGSRMGFLGPSFLPWICWIREMLILLPVIIIAECTTLFDHETFAAAVACHYTLVSLVFSPTDVGMPVERIRKYMVLRRTTVCKSLMDFTPEGFGRVFFRQVKINGDVFYRAPAEMVEQLPGLLFSLFSGLALCLCPTGRFALFCSNLLVHNICTRVCMPNALSNLCCISYG